MIAARTASILFQASLNIYETPIGDFPVEPEILFDLPLSQAAARLGLMNPGPDLPPSLDWGNKKPELGNRPLHNDL